MRDISFLNRLQLILVGEFKWGRRGILFAMILYMPFMIGLLKVVALYAEPGNLLTLSYLFLFSLTFLIYFLLGKARKRLKKKYKATLKVKREEVKALFFIYSMFYLGFAALCLLLLNHLLD